MLFQIPKVQTFESQSQRMAALQTATNCCSRYQRYKLLRANHNLFIGLEFVLHVVPDTKGTNFWEPITTDLGVYHSIILLFQIPKVQTFESQSQLLCNYLRLYRSCSRYQRYKLLRANHNKNEPNTAQKAVVPDTKGTNFWEPITTRNLFS